MTIKGISPWTGLDLARALGLACVFGLTACAVAGPAGVAPEPVSGAAPGEVASGDLASAFEPIAEAPVSSPDGRTVLTLTSEDGQPRYAVTRDGEDVVGTSRLGLRFAHGVDLDWGLVIQSVEQVSRDETWEQPWGERQFIRDHHNELLVKLRRQGAQASSDGGAAYDLRVRVFDGGVAFRYEVPDSGPRAIVDEITEFTVDGDATAWWTPAGEFNRLEYTYRTTPVSTMERAHTPFTLKLNDAAGTHIAIHEAALVNYGAMWLDQRRAGKLEADISPRHDGVKVRIEGAFKTPWRVIQVADDAAGLINGSDIYLNLNEPNALGNVSYVEPGKYIGIWWGMHINTFTWGSGPKHGATTENTKRYIDFAAEHGFSGVLVEGWNIGWDGDWFNNGDLFRFAEPYPDFDLEALSAYAAEKGVRLIGHHETSGNISNYEDQMEAAFDLYAANGITAVKTGYVADASDLKFIDGNGHARYTWHGSQERVDHDIRVLKAAHARGIAINAHEPVKDTGLRRTYPNAMTREGARGMEFNAWGTPPNTVEHQAILPFTRMLSGPFDFTPGIFDLMPNGPEDQNRVPTTLAKQLALYVTIYSPLQMAADLPENYEANMAPFQFIKDVPADWAETVALQGAVGDYAVIARKDRGSEDWYLGGVTDEAARTVTVPLDFLEAGRVYTAEIYRDGDGAHWDTNPYAVDISTRQALTANDQLTLTMAAGGGFAVRFAADATGGGDVAGPLPVSGTRTLDVSAGTLLRWEALQPANGVSARDIRIWLPPGYDTSEAPYPVIYMHDGQNLFEPGIAVTGDEWQADETAARMMAEGAIEPVIIVGVSSTETRWQDYAPAAFVSGLPKEMQGEIHGAGMAPTSDAYLDFLVHDLKPRIDARFRTLPDREHTFTAGASMGGLISLYALSRHPDTFAGAAGLSTHWPLIDPMETNYQAITPAIMDGLDAGGLDPARHRLWLDLGDQNLDSFYGPYQTAMDAYFMGNGFGGEGFESRFYEGADHNEASWAARFGDVLTFLVGKRADAGTARADNQG